MRLDKQLTPVLQGAFVYVEVASNYPARCGMRHVGVVDIRAHSAQLGDCIPLPLHRRKLRGDVAIHCSNNNARDLVFHEKMHGEILRLGAQAKQCLTLLDFPNF